MNTSTLIDNILAYTENVASGDGDNTVRRARILLRAQEVFNDAWHYREWRWKLTTGDVTVLATTSSIVVPVNFQDFGAHGGAFDPDGRKLEEVPPQRILEYRESTQPSGTLVDMFSLFDFDTSTGRVKFQIPLTVTSNTTYTLYYNRIPPTLVDATDSTNNLYFIPAQYHESVVLAGVIAKMQQQKGDTRDWYGAYQRGLAYMWLNERPRKTAVQQLPMALRGGY